jgi:drug/metabolite transporter (DMT)-like permease
VASILDRPRLLLTLTCLLWAGNVIVGRAVVGTVPPVTLACLRWTFAALLFLPFAWPHLKKDAAAIAANWRILLFLGLNGPALYNTLSYFGLVWTSAVNSLVLNAAGPMVITLMAWGIFGDKLQTAQVLGMAVALLGVLIIVAKGNLLALAAFHFNPGDIVTIAGILCWAIYTACLRLRPPLSWQSFSFITYAIAGLVNMPLAYAEFSLGYTMALDWTAAGAVFYVAIFPSLAGYILYNRAVELLGPASASLYLFLIPVFGAVLATALLGETLAPFHAAGFALIIGGVAVGSQNGLLRLRRTS